MRMRLLLGLLVLGSFAGGVRGDDSMRQVLIPILYVGADSGGVQWAAAAIVQNRSTETISNPGVEFFVECPIPEGCLADELLPGYSGAIVAPPRAAGGLILSVPKAIGDQLIFSSRVAASPRNVLDDGTDLPLPWDSEFTDQPLIFLQVPLQNFVKPSRTMIRVYSLEPGPGITVRVRLSDYSEDIQDYELEPLATDEAGNPIFPAYRAIDPRSGFSGKFTFHDVGVEPLPAPDGHVPRIWAFVSVVAESTNEVTIWRPQLLPCGD